MDYIIKKNLLIISGDKGLYSITDAIFKGRHTVYYADSANNAYNIFDTIEIHLAIITPKINETGKTKPQDSLRFLADLRASGNRAANVPVIYAAHDVKQEVVIKANDLNVSDIIKLPFDPLSFDKNIEKLLIKFAPPRERPDPVTGLPKRRLGEERVANMLENGKKGALMLVDLDYYSFLSTNVSDKAMITCRDIIAGEISQNAIFSVVKGGGFLLFIPELKERGKIEQYAEKLIEKIIEQVEDKTVFVSIGLAVSERHGKNYVDLYLACDKGLGEARKGGKNKARFYRW